MKDIIVITETSRQVVTHLDDLKEAMRYVESFGHKAISAHYWEDDPQNEASDAYGVPYSPQEVATLRDLIDADITWNEYDAQVIDLDFTTGRALCLVFDDSDPEGEYLEMISFRHLLA